MPSSIFEVSYFMVSASAEVAGKNKFVPIIAVNKKIDIISFFILIK